MENNQGSYISEGKGTIPFNKDFGQHQYKLQKEEHDYNKELKDKEYKYEQDMLREKLGRIGRTFGSPEHSAQNITATVCILLILAVGIVSILEWIGGRNFDFIKSMWKTIIPIITLSLGYLFGKK